MALQAWWDSLDQLLRVLYCIAIPASVILLIQVILTIIGFGGAGAPDAGTTSAMDLHGLDGAADFSGADSAHLGFVPADGGTTPTDSALQAVDPDALRLFSMAGIICFMTVFGWSAIVLYQGGLSGAVSVLIGFILGIGAMFGVAKIIRWTVRLAESGNLLLENAIEKTARVYIPIPAAGVGEGKINLTLQERFVELAAITDEDAGIPSGTLVRVTGVRGDALVVESKFVVQGEPTAHSAEVRNSTHTIGG